jgi:hypothetical protein
MHVKNKISEVVGSRLRNGSFLVVLMLRNTTRPTENDRIEKEQRILSGNATNIHDRKLEL